MTARPPALEVSSLRVGFDSAEGTKDVVRGLSLRIAHGEAVALVGESGCGKSMAALGMMRLLPRGARVIDGSIKLDGLELLAVSEREMSRVRGRDISIIFQDPLTSLNPALTIGRHLTDVIRAHQPVSRSAALERAAELLSMVGIPAPRTRLHAFPHQFSGGMRQRVAIAMSVACEPKVLIADEPTTALDVTMQGQVIDLLARLRSEMGIAILFISHNLDLVAEICDRVAVMYTGAVVESDEVERLFTSPRHPYTQKLLNCIPRLAGGSGLLPSIPGAPPRLGTRIEGCSFAPRCETVQERCRRVPPPVQWEGDHRIACWAVES